MALMRALSVLLLSWNELFLEKIKEPLGLTASELQFGRWVIKTEQYRDQYRFPATSRASS